MKNSAIVRMVIWAAVALALISVLSGMAAKNKGWRLPVFHLNEMIGRSSLKADHILSGGTLNGDAVTDVKLAWVSGPVAITAGEEGSPIKFTEYAAEGVGNEFAARVEVKSGTLVVEQYNSNGNGGWNFNFGKNHYSRLELELPPKLYNSVVINQVSGATQISQLNGSSLELNTVSGEVTLDSVNFADAKLDSVSGNLDGTVYIGKLRVNAVSAEVNLKGSLDDVRFDGVSGNLRLESSKALNALTAEAVSGRVELIQPDGDGFRIKTSRDIDSMVDSDYALTSSGSKSGYYKDSRASAMYEFSALSGKVRIKKPA